MAMTGTEFARVSGSYSTAYIGTYQVQSQNVANNTTTFTLRGYFYYGGGSSVSSSNSTFKLDGTTIKTGSYTYSNGYHLLGTKTITITHNNDGSFPGKSIKIVGDSYHIDGSKSGSITAPKINRLAQVIYALDFNDEENPYIRVYNPGGYDVAPYLNFKLNDVTVVSLVREKGYYPSTYVWNLTEEERTQIRTALSETNSCIVTQGVDTWDGNTKLGYNAIKTNFNIVNANPIFNNFTYEDTNGITYALTRNRQTIIKNYSDVVVKIYPNDLATPQKNATITNYLFSCNDKTQIFYYYGDEYASGKIFGVTSGIFNVYAVDSRNNSTLVTKLATNVIEYTELVKGNISVARQTGTSEETILTLDGKINLVNFGSVTNSIKTAKTRYKQSDSDTWSNYSNITLTVDSNGNFSFNGLIQGDTNLGFDEANSYNIEVVISDELSTITYTANLGSAIPNIALHKNGVGIMGKYDPSVGGDLQVRGVDVMKKFEDFYFKNGDTYTFNGEIYTGGVLTGGRKSVMCTIPLPKFATGLNVTLTSGTIYIRGINGYLVNGDSISNAINIITTTIENILTIEFVYPEFTSATNNTPLSVAFRDLSLSFSN